MKRRGTEKELYEGSVAKRTQCSGKRNKVVGSKEEKCTEKQSGEKKMLGGFWRGKGRLGHKDGRKHQKMYENEEE